MLCQNVIIFGGPKYILEQANGVFVKKSPTTQGLLNTKPALTLGILVSLLGF